MPYTKPLTLLFNGGGNRFYAYVGVLKGVIAKGLKIEKIIGSSTSAIIAALYATGHTPEWIENVMLELDTDVFRDKAESGFRSRMGLYSGLNIMEWLENLFQGKTFAAPLDINLQIVVTDIQNYRPLVFTKDHYADVPIAAACRATMSTPLLFQPMPLKYKGKEHLLLDGSLMCGLIELGLSRNENDRSLTFKVVSKRDLHHKGVAAGDWKAYLPEIFEFYLHYQEKEYIKGGQWRDNILIHCGTISPARFTLTVDERKTLIDEGFKQTVKYLEYKCGL